MAQYDKCSMFFYVLNVFVPYGCVTLFGGAVGIKVIDKFCAGTWGVLSYGCPLADSIIPRIYQNKAMISQSSFLRCRTPDHPPDKLYLVLPLRPQQGYPTNQQRASYFKETTIYRDTAVLVERYSELLSVISTSHPDITKSEIKGLN